MSNKKLRPFIVKVTVLGFTSPYSSCINLVLISCLLERIHNLI